MNYSKYSHALILHLNFIVEYSCFVLVVFKGIQVSIGCFSQFAILSLVCWSKINITLHSLQGVPKTGPLIFYGTCVFGDKYV